jgi:hypothetical protein
MARITHAAQIDLRFGDLACEVQDFRVAARPGDLARERFHVLRQCRIGTNGKAERVAKRVSRRTSAAFSGLRAGAGPGIRAVGLDLAVARQAAFFSLVGIVSITSNSPSSILLYAASQRLAEDRPTPIDLA